MREEISELQNPYLHIYTPVEFKLTQIMSSNSSKQVDASAGSMLKKKQEEDFLQMLSDYQNRPLTKSCTIGLKNLGNNCYMNAVVQTLVNNPILYYYLKNLSENSFQGDSLKFSALGFMKRLLNVCYGGVSSKGKELKHVRLTSLVKNIDQINKRFERGEQQDAMIFMRGFLQRLMTEISPTKIENSSFYKLFTGKKIRSIFCPECKFNQEIEEKMPSVGILEGFDRTLKQARQSALKDIQIAGWKCQRCESDITAVQKTKVIERKLFLKEFKLIRFNSASIPHFLYKEHE